MNKADQILIFFLCFIVSIIILLLIGNWYDQFQEYKEKLDNLKQYTENYVEHVEKRINRIESKLPIPQKYSDIYNQSSKKLKEFKNSENIISLSQTNCKETKEN